MNKNEHRRCRYAHDPAYRHSIKLQYAVKAEERAISRVPEVKAAIVKALSALSQFEQLQLLDEMRREEGPEFVEWILS